MKTKELAFGALIMAIILLMAAIPQLGYIQVGASQVTIIHIPVLIGAMAFKNRKLALIAGTTFGLSSWLVAMFRPAGPIDLIFQNPLVSVVPRILFALLAFYLYKVLSEKMKNDYPPKVITAVVATIFHTVAVVSMMYIFGQHIFTDGLVTLLVGIATVHGWIEVVLAAIIVPIIMIALQRVIKIS